MQIFLATDIFGQTAHVEMLTKGWQTAGHQVELISPSDMNEQFVDEASAYEAFSKSGGIEHYVERIKAGLTKYNLEIPIMFIGFSAGGAALWRALSDIETAVKSHLIAFYPGQIRHYLDLQPKLPSTLIFPRLEQHFDLTKVIEYLVTKPSVKVIQNEWLHGYANPQSKNYSQSDSETSLQLLTNVELCIEPESFSNGLTKLNASYRELN